eukprot:IDg10367t1
MAYGTQYGGQYAQAPRSRPKRNNRKFRRRKSPKELKELKAKIRCLRCNIIGHWKAECPSRHLSMTGAIRARVIKRGGTECAVAEVLLTIAHDDDNNRLVPCLPAGERIFVMHGGRRGVGGLLCGAKRCAEIRLQDFAASWIDNRSKWKLEFSH